MIFTTKHFILALVCLCLCATQAQGQIPAGDFRVVSASAEWTFAYTPSLSGYASNVLPSTPYGAGWNAAVPGQGQRLVDWLVFDLLRLDFVVSLFTFSASGDGVHDPSSFALQRGLTADGPWFDVGPTYSPTVGINTTQTFTVPATASRYWRWRILATGSGGYQSYVSKVNFFGLPTTTPQQLNEFSVAHFSTQLVSTTINGFVTNLLPTSNPLALSVIGWNSGTPGPVWLIFDLKSAAALHITGFQFASLGDVTHDTQSFSLLRATSANGPWTTVLSTTAASGTSAVQTFTFSAVSARYWQFSISTTYSIYQAYVTYANFLVTP